MPHTQDQRSMFWKLSIPSQFLLLVKPQLKVPASGFFNPSFSHCDRRLESADRPLPGLSLSDYLDGWVIDHRRPWRLWRTCITLCVHGRSVTHCVVGGSASRGALTEISYWTNRPVNMTLMLSAACSKDFLFCFELYLKGSSWRGQRSTLNLIIP